MARSLRVEYAGAFYHVLNRGNAAGLIFKSSRDREKFLEYLGKTVERFFIRIHAYCLMPNHYHLLIETPEPNLSRAIQWINVSYATYFNRKRDRHGHLFQGRFKAILIEADEYLKQLSRYIHLNPVRAKLVDKPAEYVWSSYPSFTGLKKPPDWLESGWLLSQFGAKKKRAEKNYKRFVEGVDLEKIANPSDDVVGGLLLGSPEFVRWVKKVYLRPRDDAKEIPQLRQLKQDVSPEKVVAAVCEVFQCDSGQILKKGRKRNHARDVAIYLARDMTGLTTVRLGEFFGGVSGAAITRRYNIVQSRKANTRKISRRLDKIRRGIMDRNSE